VRKEAQERLRLAEASIDQSADPTFWVASDARFLRVNDAACEALGYSRDELLSMTVQDIDPLFTREVWPAHWAEFVEMGSLKFESVHRAKDGREFPVEISVSLVRLDGQEMMFSYVHDISERKAAEERLLLANASIDQSRDSTFWVASDGRIVRVNEAACEALGYSRDELLTMTVQDIDPLDAAEDFAAKWAEVSEKGSLSFESVHRAKDGREFPVEISVSRIAFDGQEMMFSYVHDISERKAAENALRESEERYRSFVKDFPGIAYRAELDWLPVFFHGRVEEITGYTEEELVSGPPRWDAVVHPDDLPTLVERDAGLRTTPGFSTDREYRIVRKDGEVRWVRDIIQNVCDESGIPIYLEGTLTDVTERKVVSEKLRVVAEKREELARIVNRSPATALLWRAAEGWPVEFVSENVRQFGYEPEDFYAGRTNFSSIVHPDDMARVSGEVFEYSAQPGREAFTQEYRILTASGDVRWVDDRTWIRRDESGQLTHYEGILLDITDRKVAEEKVREQNTFLNQILESLTHPFYVIDAETYGVVLANSAACPGPLEEGTTCHMLTHGSPEPCRDPGHRCPLEEVKRTKATAIAEHVHLDADGNERVVEVHAYPILDDSGEVVRMIEYALDITDRKMAEEEVRSLARFPSENPAPVMRLDRDGTIIYANAASAEVLEEWGVTAGGRAPDRRCAVVAEALRNGTQKTEEVSCCGRDYMLVIAPVPDAGYANLYASDVTERKRAEEDVREERAYLASIFKAAPVGIVVTVDRVAVEGNERIATMLGFGPEEVAERSARTFYATEEEYERVGAAMREGVERDGSALVETRFRRTDGADVDVLLSVAPIDPADPSRGMMNVVTDITDLKRAEDLMRLQRDLALSLSAAPGLEGGLRLSLDAAISASGMDCGGVYVVDEATGGLDLLAHTGLSPGFAGSVSHFDADSENARLIKASAPVYTGYGSLVDSYSTEDVREGLKTIAILPMRHKGRVVGCLNIASHSVDEVPESGRVALEAIAGQIGGAIARLKAERELQKSERKFRGFVESFPVGMFEADGDGRVLYTNPQWGVITGMSLEQSLGDGWAGALHPDERDRVLAIWDECVREKKGYSGGFRFVRPSGETRRVHVRTVPIIDETGAVTSHVGSVADVTESERAAEAVRASEALLAKTQAIGHIGSWELDLDADILKWSDEVYRIFGLQPHEFSATHEGFLQCVHPDDRADVDSAYAMSLRNRDDGYETEHRIVRPDNGEVRTVREKCEHVKDASGRVVRSIGMVQDTTERKRAEEALREARDELERRVEERTAELAEAERRLREFVEGTDALVTQVDAEGRFIFVNRAAEKILGCPAHECVGRLAFDFVYPDDREATEAAFAKWVEGRVTSASFENRQVSSTGEVSHMLWTINPRYDDDGNVTSIWSVARDITERKRAEEDLRREKERLQTIADNIPVMLTVYDPHGRFETVNREFTRLIGWTADEAAGIDLMAACYPDAQVRREAWEYMREARPGWRDFEITTKDGRTIDTAWAYVRLSDGTTIGIGIDITERMQFEEKLRRSGESFELLVRSLPDAITVTDRDGIIKYVSNLRAELHGHRSAGQFLGSEAAALVVPEDRDRLRANFLRALETGAAEATELTLLRDDGSTFIGDVSFGVIRDTDGRPDSIVTVVRDVTNRKTLEKRLEESQRLEAVGRLAGGLAHDFNNLLTAIGGFARRITKKLRPESPLRDDAGQIEKASDMAASLTSQLLAFSRRQTMQPVVLTLNEVLDDVEIMLKRLIGEDIELVIKRASRPGLTLADPGQIGQVIVNLAVNSRDAMPHGGVLTIESSDIEFGAEEAFAHQGVPPGAYVTVSVTDTGAGIPPDVLPHIFEPFYTTKEMGKGTGLGLSTVYGIVAQSNGHVRVSSEVGRGSTFTIYLPRIAAGHEEEPGGAIEASDETLKGGETILLVEDEEAVKELTRLTLADYGYRVLVASDGKEAIALAAGHEGPIHLLLTDVVMPQMSGREVAERIVAGRPETKVVFMSGYVDNVEVRGIGGGETPLLPKPFGAEDLALMVREALDSERERPAAN